MLRTQPASEALVLAVDIGTGSVRAVLFAPGGLVAGLTQEPLTIEHPSPGWSEQDPDAVVAATARVIREALRTADHHGGVSMVAFSSQMYSVLAADRHGMPMTMSLPWTDTRAAASAAQIRAIHDGHRLPAITGCPTQAIYPLAKIRWLLENAALTEDALFVSIKDHVLWRLTGTLVADRSTASASGLMSIATQDWSDEALAVAGIDRRRLPRLDSPMASIERQPGDMLSVLGLSPSVPVLLGAGDAPLSNIGCGAVTQEVLAINIGTSAAARRMVNDPRTDPLGRLWTYVADDHHWVVGGIIGSAGATWDWMVDLAEDGRGSEAYHAADSLAASVGPGAAGLTFLPYFTGEQSPDWRPSARGAFVGLGLHHERAHLLRATLEGIAFALQRVRLEVESQGAMLSEVAVTGGVTRSEVARQILADVLGLPVLMPPGHEGSALGAAVLAWVAMGVVPDLESFGRATLAGSARTLPSEASAFYRARYREFVAIADRLGDLAGETAR